MEAQHILDPGRDLDIFVFRIQLFLDRFVQRFNFHSVSTEHNRTPRQLWASGCLRNFNSLDVGIRDVLDAENPNDLDFDGDDPDVPLSDPDNEVPRVEIPVVDYQLDNEVLLVMEQNFDPLTDDNNYGINIYLQVQEFINLIKQSRQDEQEHE